MPEDTQDQPIEEVVEEEEEEKDDQPEDTASKTKPQQDEMPDWAKALRKGYTQTRQDMSSLKDTIIDELSSKISELIPQKTEDGEDTDYPTKSEIRKMINDEVVGAIKSVKESEIKAQKETEDFISGKLDDLESEGVISGKSERKEFTDMMIECGVGDFKKATVIWNKLQESKSLAEEKKIKEDAAEQAKKENAGKVGSSSKSGQSISSVNINDIHGKDWSDI